MKKQKNANSVSLLKIMTYGIFAAILIVSLGVVSVFADGNEELGITLPVFTGKYDVGIVSLGSFGLRGEATSLMKIPEDAEIIAGYVYLSGYSNLSLAELGDIPVVFSNDDSSIVNVTAQLIGYSTDYANQCFTYRAEVTAAVTTGEHRYKLQSYSLPVRPTGGKLYGGGLIVIYSRPNSPEVDIWIADGLDYFDANNGFPTTSVVSFPFQDNRFERYGSVKMFAGVDDQNSASAVWYEIGHGDLNGSDIVDAPGAVDYNNSSNSDPAQDTDPLSEGLGLRRNWTMVEFLVKIQSEEGWASFQLESQTDNSTKPAFSGVWNMVAFKLPLEETGCGNIGDRVFYDKNENGIREEREAGIPTVLVSLFKDDGDNVFDAAADEFIDSVRTNRLGFYLFKDLQFGTYFVDVDHEYINDGVAALTTQTDPAGPIELTDCTPMLDIDFGFLYTGVRPTQPVTMDSFRVFGNYDFVTVNWYTDANTENLGFDVFRSDSLFGDYSAINPEIIPVSNSSADNHEYTFVDENVESGETYYYKIADVNMDGSTTMYGPVEGTAAESQSDVAENAGENKPVTEFKLGDAYPNPFNGATTIRFFMKQTGYVKIELHNLLGQKIRTLVAEDKTRGVHSVIWDAKDAQGNVVGSGTYFVKMTTENFQYNKRILYLK